VVLIGTYKALSVLSGEFSQMRRGTGQGDLIWDRLSNDEQWRLFVESLWRFQYTRKKRTLEDDPELSEALYEETQGIVDLAVKVYMFAQERAIDSGKEVITPAIIRSAAKDKLRLPRPVLEALKLGDRRALERYEDVYPTHLKTHLRQPPERSKSDGQLDSSPDRQVPVKESDETRTPASSENVATPARNTPHKRGKKAPAIAKGELPRFLSAVQAERKTSIYDALQRAGYVRPSEELLDGPSSREGANP
jgi:hypothetical protein